MPTYSTKVGPQHFTKLELHFKFHETVVPNISIQALSR